MSYRKILKKSKLFILLLSCLMLAAIKTYAHPPKNTIPQSLNVTSSNRSTADDYYDSYRSSDSEESSYSQRREIINNRLNKRYSFQLPDSNQADQTLGNTAKRHGGSDEKPNLESNPPEPSYDFYEISRLLADSMMGKSNKPTSTTRTSDLKNSTIPSENFITARKYLQNFFTSTPPTPTPAPSGPIPTPPSLPSVLSVKPDPSASTSAGSIPIPPPLPSALSVKPDSSASTSSGPIPTSPALPSVLSVKPDPSASTSAGPIPTSPALPSVSSTESDSSDAGQELSNAIDNTEGSESYVTSSQELDIDASYTKHKLKNIYSSGKFIFSKGDKSEVNLIITGNYIGKNGFISLSPTAVKNNMVLNRLIIRGNSSGLTNVSIKNIGGTDSSSLNDLKLIHVDGLSEGIFNQAGRITAGAYDYSLVRGDGNNRGNWYLTNKHNSNNRIERPEAASYIANLSASNTLFTTTLNDRPGETQFTDRQTGKKKITSLWLRQVGNNNNWYDSNNQLKTQSKSYVTMLGGDVMKWSSNGHKQGRLGLMAGYGNNSSNSRSSITNYHSKGSVEGYSIGSYATWFTNNTDKLGLYVDGWIQYNWLNNHVHGQKLPKENYKSKGINAAIETGYTIKVGEFIKHQGMAEQWFIQPQTQITKMGVKAKKHREANGTRVIGGGKGNIQTRLGIRTYLKGQHAMDKDKNREFEPFIEANWLHNTRKFDTTLDGDSISQAGTRNIGEVKVGIAGKFNSQVNIWGNIGTQIADKGYSNTSVTVGVKYNF